MVMLLKELEGADPIAAGQLTRAEIESCQEDPEKNYTELKKKKIFQKLREELEKNIHHYQKDKIVQMQFFGLLEIILNFLMHKYRD